MPRDNLCKTHADPDLRQTRPKAPRRMHVSVRAAGRVEWSGCTQSGSVNSESTFQRERQMSTSETVLQIEYPESDGEPLGETDLHIHWIIRLRDILKYRYRD
jgi:hypothetical protein